MAVDRIKALSPFCLPPESLPLPVDRWLSVGLMRPLSRRVCGISVLAACPEVESAFLTPLDHHRRG